MKLAELVIGKDYLHNRSNSDWQTTTGVGSWGVQRVRIASLEVTRWEVKNGNWQKTLYSSRGAQGICVHVVDVETGEIKGKDVVTLASLRGPWETTWKKVQENHAERQRTDKERDEKRKMVQQIAGVACSLAKAIGITKSQSYGDGRVLVDGAEFLAMVQRLDQVGWKYEK